MESESLKTKILYWTSPIIGYICNFIILIALMADYSYSRDPNGLVTIEEIFSASILSWLLGNIPVVFSYIYLTLLHCRYKSKYKYITIVAIICNIIILAPIILFVQDNSNSFNLNGLFIILLTISYFIPAYWMAYKRYGNGSKKLGLYVIAFEIIWPLVYILNRLI